MSAALLDPSPLVAVLDFCPTHRIGNPIQPRDHVVPVWVLKSAPYSFGGLPLSPDTPISVTADQHKWLMARAKKAGERDELLRQQRVIDQMIAEVGA